MGQAKDHMYDEERQGFYHPPKKQVCVNHINDFALKTYISGKAHLGKCDYCGVTTQVFHLHDLVERIAGKIHKHYNDIANEAGYDSSTWRQEDGENDGFNHVNGYILPGNRSGNFSEELLGNLGLYDDLNNEDLYNDIVRCFPDDILWRERDVYGTRMDEELKYKWSDFCELVKHKRRYTFFQHPEFDDPEHSDNGLSDILTEISEVVQVTNLIQTIPAGTKIYRCRNHKKDDKVDQPANLVSPLPKQAIFTNRMSPAGIPMFYGGFDSKIVREEAQGASECQTVGELELLEDIAVIDFTHLPRDVSFWGDVPLEPIRFLSSFVTELSKPISPDDAHLQYVPTQILTEHFKFHFKENDVQGMIYESTKYKGCRYCVLFLNQEECLQKMKLTNVERFSQT